MRRLITILALFTALCCQHTYAQEYTRNGKTFEQTASSRSSQGKKTEYKWKDTRGEEYPVYVSANGSCYVLKVSQKSGKEYRKYLGEQISKEICTELGIKYTYQPKQKKQ